MASTQDQSQNVCGICLASAASRGGVPLCCPGCCGKWFHQNCFDDLVKSGIQECPMCRTTFPNLVGAGAPPAPPVLQQQQQILLSAPLQQQQQQQLPQQAQQQAGIFNRLSSYFSTASISNSNVPTQNRNVVHQQQLQYSSNVYSPRFGGSPNSSAVPAMSAEEDKLSTEQIAANNSSTGGNTTSTTSNTTAAAATPRLTVSTTPEFPHTSLAANSAFYARFSLKYEESAAAAGRKVPLDVVCVLDNSGSMSGSKIESLKKAMQFVMDTLGPDDRLAVVNFNSYATTLHGLLKMNPSNRTQAKDQIRALYATGGTDIYAGMKSGWDLLAQRQTKNPASCMFLLTDGQDTSNLREKLELAKQMKAAGTSLFVFGFGSDHDSEHMNAIANGAEGVFSYVESDDMVTDAFGGTIGTQQGLSLSNIQLTLDCAERDVKVVQLMTGYRHTLASTGRSGTVHFVNMFLGEQRDIIVKLSLPAVDSAVDDYELLRGSATFQITGSTTTYNAENVGICTVHRLPDNKLPVGTVRDLEVDIQLNRLDCTAAINAALSEADKSNFGAARDQLESAKIKLQTSVSYQHALTLSGGASSSSTTLPGNLNTVLALMQEIEDALQRVQSRSAYDNGGRAMMQEASNQNTYQRTTYNKAGRVNKYQSPASMQMQSCAFASKGSY